jgi:hypothetical protein
MPRKDTENESSTAHLTMRNHRSQTNHETTGMSESASPKDTKCQNKAHSIDTILLELQKEWKAILSVFITVYDSEEAAFQAFKKILYDEWSQLRKIRKKLKRVGPDRRR